jgi:hypothetical protein
MKRKNLKWTVLLTFALFTLMSCSEEDELITITDTDGDTITSVFSDSTTEMISQWNDLWLELDRYATGMRPNVTSRALAYIHLAAYETAVHEIDDYTSNTDRLIGFDIDFSQRPDNLDIDIALNTCYSDVLDHFMINVQNGVETGISILENNMQSSLSADVSQDVIDDSVAWGTYVAQRVIAYALTDSEAETQILEPQPLSYEPPVGDGFWTYSADEERALFPYWGSVRTFVISSEETTSVAPPIEYSEDVESAYYAQMKEVQEVNDLARAEDNEQLWIAEFWSDDVEGLMISPPGRQLAIANQLIEQYDLDYKESLVLLLKLGFSLNDAAVSTWADKYEYMVMRPNVYIHEFIDPDFQTNLFRLVFWPNPSFPGYPSGHSTFASAAAGIFIDKFGDATSFTDRTHEGRTEFRGEPRQFNTFSQMAEENAFSRIPLGVHIRMDCTEGLRLGYEISDAVNNYEMTVQ